MKKEKTAQVYAKALMEYAEDSRTRDKSLEDISMILDVFKKTPGLNDFLKNPVIGKEKKIELLKAGLLPKLSEGVHRFVILLFQKSRLPLLKEVSENFIRLDEESRNILRAQIISATQLSPQQLENITRKLEASRPGKTFILSNRVDDSLIAGFQIKEGDHITDASVKHQLLTLKRKLAA